MRATFYSAANAMLMRSVASSEIKIRDLRLMRRNGRRRAVVAVARKLSVVMHRIWADNTEFRHSSLEAALCPDSLPEINGGIVPHRTRSVDDAEYV